MNLHKISSKTNENFGLSKQIKSILTKKEKKTSENRKVNGYWKSKGNQKATIINLEKKLKINSKEDWYKINSTQIPNGLYSQYYSLTKMLQNIYPNFIWLPWKFDSMPNGFWLGTKGKFNRRQYFDNFSKLNNVKLQKDWYTCSVYSRSNYVYKSYGAVSLYCLTDLYPEISWIPWKFSQVPYGFWDTIQNQKSYLKDIEKNNNIKKPEDWYKMTSSFLHSTINRNYNSLMEMISNIYPNQIWLPWKFDVVPSGCWDGLKGKYNRRQYFDDFSKLNNIKLQKDWYSISLYKKEVRTFWAEIYKSVTLYSLEDLYPEINWIPWKFKHVPSGFWKSKENILNFIKYCEKKLNIQSDQDWQYITTNQIQDLGGRFIFKNFGSIYNVLIFCYPEKKISNYFTIKNSSKFLNLTKK